MHGGAGSIRHSLQDRLSKVSGKGRPDEITVKLCTSTGSFAILPLLPIGEQLTNRIYFVRILEIRINYYIFSFLLI